MHDKHIKGLVGKEKAIFLEAQKLGNSEHGLLHKLLLSVYECLTVMGPFFFFLRVLLPKEKENIYSGTFKIVFFSC